MFMATRLRLRVFCFGLVTAKYRNLGNLWSIWTPYDCFSVTNTRCLRRRSSQSGSRRPRRKGWCCGNEKLFTAKGAVRRQNAAARENARRKHFFIYTFVSHSYPCVFNCYTVTSPFAFNFSTKSGVVVMHMSIRNNLSDLGMWWK